MISAIVAVDDNWGIGFNGELLEHIPDDLKRFKELTTNHIVIMGRKTWDSLPNKPLPNRLNFVITRSPRRFGEMTAFIHMNELISRMNTVEDDEEWFIIGGGTIYEELLPFCNRVYITKIYKNHENVDTYFPNLDKMDDWTVTEKSSVYKYNDLSYQFWQYDRI